MAHKTCSQCGKTSETVTFAAGSNICRSCVAANEIRQKYGYRVPNYY